MSDPRHHIDSDGGRHTTHTPFSLSDSDPDEDEDFDPSDIFEGWGFDAADYYEEDEDD